MENLTDEELTMHLRQVIARYARKVESPMALGPEGALRFEYFNDLLSASHVDAHLAIMTDSLVRLIRSNELAESTTVIACPKRGNSLLGRSVARALNLKSVFVRDEALASRYVEGSYKKHEKVILVDDVSSDGDLLLDAVYGLRREGMNIERAFTVVDRKEGNAEKRLQSEGISLHYCISLEDDDVLSLIDELKTEATRL